MIEFKRSIVFMGSELKNNKKKNLYIKNIRAKYEKKEINENFF